MAIKNLLYIDDIESEIIKSKNWKFKKNLEIRKTNTSSPAGGYIEKIFEG